MHHIDQVRSKLMLILGLIHCGDTNGFRGRRPRSVEIFRS